MAGGIDGREVDIAEGGGKHMTYTAASMSRRQLLGGAAGMGLLTRHSVAQTAATGSTAAALPQRGDIVIRKAVVMTMDPSLGDLGSGDVHIAGGMIRAVGQNLAAPGATEIDGSDMIALPGFVDTHTHLWSTQMRGRFGDTPETIYFRIRNLLGDEYRADDVYHGTRLGAAESVASGITTAVDFFHNNRGPDYADAAIRALKESGLRCRFLLGPSTRTQPTESMDLATLEALNGAWITLAEMRRSRSVSLGADRLALRRPHRASRSVRNSASQSRSSTRRDG